MYTFTQVIHELSKIPDGRLQVRTDRSTLRYFYRYSHYGLRFYLRVPDNLVDTALQLEQRRQELQDEFDYYMKYKTDKEARRYRTWIKDRRRQKLARIIADHRLYKNHYVYYTPHGDYVASKTEAMISMLLMIMGITFHYEVPREVSENQFIRPDFTLSIIGKRYYYEHLGKTYDPTYMANWLQRLEQYHANNIYEKDQLLITREDGNGLDLLNIRQQIQKFIDSKI